MLILAFLMNAALANTPPRKDCAPSLKLTEDRGVDFYDRIATAAAVWYDSSPDPRRPQILNYNVTEVRHGANGDGSAIVEVQTKLGQHRLPILVRVQFERDQITQFSVADRGHKELGESTDAPGIAAENAAMARLLTSSGGPVKDLTAKTLSRKGHQDGLREVLVSASINDVAFEKIYVVFLGPDGVVRVDDSGTHRYPQALLAHNFKDLLLGEQKDPTLRIISIDRQSVRSWRVLYSRGNVERVTGLRKGRSNSKRSADQVEITADRKAEDRIVLKGDGLIPRSKMLRVDDDHRFSLFDETGR